VAPTKPAFVSDFPLRCHLKRGARTGRQTVSYDAICKNGLVFGGGGGGGVGGGVGMLQSIDSRLQASSTNRRNAK
jgi:hypothetical protein